MESNDTLRYVVLHHVDVERPHFDLLFETSPGSELSAFRLREWPMIDASTAEAGAKHRRLYLDYEGPISNGRGSVRRVAAGACRVVSEAGQRTLQLDTGQRWPIHDSR